MLKYDLYLMTKDLVCTEHCISTLVAILGWVQSLKHKHLMSSEVSQVSKVCE